MTKSKNVRVHSNTGRKRRKIRKAIKETIIVSLVALIGAVAMIAVFFGAVFQEQDKLAEMAAAEMEIYK